MSPRFSKLPRTKTCPLCNASVQNTDYELEFHGEVSRTHIFSYLSEDYFPILIHSVQREDCIPEVTRNKKGFMSLYSRLSTGYQYQNNLYATSILWRRDQNQRDLFKRMKFKQKWKGTHFVYLLLTGIEKKIKPDFFQLLVKPAKRPLSL